MIDLMAIERREAEVIGDHPRIEPLDAEPCRDEILAFADQVMLADSARLPVVELADFPEYVPTMLHHPGLFERQTAVGLFLLSEGALSPRDRELAVLRIAWLCQAPYEWGEHVFIARRIGIVGDEIERIIIGSTAEGWSDIDRAIVAGVEELHGDAAITDATWAVLAKHWDKRQLIEFPLLVGLYQSTAYLQNALRMRLHTGNAGLRAR